MAMLDLYIGVYQLGQAEAKWNGARMTRVYTMYVYFEARPGQSSDLVSSKKDVSTRHPP